MVYVPGGTPSSTSLDGYDRDMAALSREQQERLRMQSLPLQSDEVGEVSSIHLSNTVP